MNQLRICIFFSVFLLSGAGVLAQNPFIRHYTSIDGLPTNTIYQMCQDSHKFLWFTSDAGVIKFDGSTFTSYRKKDGLSSNDVVRIKEDAQGRIWFFNYNATVNYFYQDKIYNEGNAPFLKQLVGKGYFLDFYTDLQQNIHFYNYQREIFTLDPRNKVTKNLLLKNYKIPNIRGNEFDSRVCFLSKNPAGEWIIWTNAGIYSQSASTGAIQAIDSSKMVRFVVPGNHNSYYAILFRSENSIIKISANQKVEKIPFDSNILAVKDILEDTEGYLWIATLGKGVFCLKNNKLIRYFEIRNAHGLLQDHERNIWVSTQSDGIYEINHDILTQAHYDRSLFNNSGINKLYEFPGMGLGCLSTNMVYLYSADKTFYKLNIPKAVQQVDIIHLFKNKTLLLGEKSKNICLLENLKLNKASKAMTYDRAILDAIQLKKIIDDRSGLLTIMFDQNRILSTLSAKPLFNVEYTEFNERINNAYFNARNELIINARQNYIYSKNSLKPYPALNRFDGYVISSHLVINDTTELLNIDGDSLFLLVRGKFYNLTKAFSSPIDLQVKQALYKDSKLYLSTLKEIFVCYNPLNAISGKPVSINQLNLGFNNINDISMDSSSLYVASDDGLTVIPEKAMFAQATPAPIPYIRSITINNVSYPLPAREISLKGKNYIQISFGCISYLTSTKTYSYKLEGAEKNWTMGSGQELDLFYRNLPPGKYSFKLRVRTTSEWSKPLVLDILIRPTLFEYPAFWATVIVVAGVLLVLLIYRIKTERMKKTEIDHQLVLLEQKALQSMMNPHFIFNSLGSIQNYLLRNKSNEAVIYLSEFTRLIRQNLKAVNTPMILLDDETERLKNYLDLEKIRLDNKFDYSIKIDPVLEEEMIYIPSMIIQPIVENSIWHGIASLNEPGRIEISFQSYTSKSLVINIRDNGIGIKKSMEYQSRNSGRPHLGMQINGKRLDLLGKKYATQASINYSECLPGNPNPGTMATVIVPFTYNISET